MSNYIMNLFKLPANTLINVKFYEPTDIDGCSTYIIKADTKRKKSYSCSHCNTIHKHTTKGYSIVCNKYNVIDDKLVSLIIKKRRLVCHSCNRSFTEAIPNIQPRARISDVLNKKIANEFITSKTNKDVAIRCFVSQSTVARKTSLLEEHIDDVNFNYLPAVIGFDEFKATKDSQDFMAFLLVSHENKAPIDILPSRKINDLTKYFSKFSQEALDSVEYITMDMYLPYMVLAKKLFKNATIVLDKFHVVQNFTRALNKTRIAYMNTLDTTSIKYKQSKHYWKLLLSFKITPSLEYKYYPKFNYKTNLSDIVHHIKNYDPILSDSYDFYQVFFTHLNNRNYDSAKSLLISQKDNVSSYLKTAIETFEKYYDGCIEAYKQEFSNALTEALVGKIKLIKRNAHGFRTFLAFKRRVMHYFATRKLEINF